MLGRSSCPFEQVGDGGSEHARDARQFGKTKRPPVSHAATEGRWVNVCGVGQGGVAQAGNGGRNSDHGGKAPTHWLLWFVHVVYFPALVGECQAQNVGVLCRLVLCGVFSTP